MAGLRLIYRLAGMAAICIALVGSPLGDAQRMAVLTAVAIGVAVTAAVPWSDRLVSRSVVPAIVIIAFVPLEAPGSIVGLVALVVLGAASCRGAGLARVVPASGLPLIALTLRTGETIEPMVVVAWVVAVAVTLLIRAAAWPSGSQPPLGPPSEQGGFVANGRRQAVTAAAVLLVVAPVALQLAYTITPLVPPVAAAISAGEPEGPRLEAHPGLDGGLDVGAPVDLSDDVVLRVRTDQPRYWRGTTYDEWDGRSWSSRLTPTPLSLTGLSADLPSIEDERSVRAALDLPQPSTVTQQFSTERAGLDVLLGAWRIESVDAPIARANVASDGSIRLDEPLGAGATWTVVSEEIPASAADLRRADPLQVDDGVENFEMYASEDEVSDAVAQLAQELTVDAPTTYDKVRAIESWMDANLTYTRDIGALTANRDPIDHLLFESKQGYCEQVGSALVVMLRSLGIPARLAVGYVPSDYDTATGSWISRASDAHTWAEVYFPGVGWRGFDPTAGVPTTVDEAPAAQLATGPSAAVRTVLIVAAVLGLWLVLTPGLHRRFPGTSLPELWARLRRGQRSTGGTRVQAVLALHRRLDRCGSQLPEVWAPTMTVRDRAESMIARGIDPDIVITAIRALERVTFDIDDDDFDRAAVSSAEAAMDALEAAILSRASASKRGGTGRWPNVHRRGRATKPNPSRSPVP